jgi:threonine aldolase
MIVDLRSDTVTRPSHEMYAAMANAPLGDDVLGDEPTVTELERIAAEKVGKEAAVFVPSGTMGNQIAMATHCERGDAVLIEEEAHMVYYEVGGPGIIANVVTWTLPSDKGILDPEVIEAHVLKRSLHTPGTSLLCLENTHNRAGGTIIPLATMAAYREIANRHNMKVHLDGARVFNASVGLGVDVREITKHVDTVNFCLSKALRSPVGSLLCGPADFIEKARIWRKRLGGGMRQAGILAACGIVSLTQMVDRLADDHRRARSLAQSLSEIPGLSIDWDRVQTNMVLVVTERPAADLANELHEKGVWCFPVATNRLRLVLHADVNDKDIAFAVEAFRALSGVKA